MLGVDSDTLRRWADSGRVEAFTTPGGHRRFSRHSLEKLISERRPNERWGLARLGATPEHLTAVYRRTYSARGGRAEEVRRVVLGPDRDAFRQDGRTLVRALLRYLDPGDESGTRTETRVAAERDAAEVAADFARRLAGSRVSLTESVALFVAARRPFLAELGRLAKRGSLDPATLAAIYEDASGLLDRLLLGFIGVYQVASAATPNGKDTDPGSLVSFKR